MPPTHFECCFCLEDKCEPLPRWVGDPESSKIRVCDECAEEAVKPLFINALQHEYQFPPMWGKELLEFFVFWDLFDDTFRKAWWKKEKEYATPTKQRLYCAHQDSEGRSVCGEWVGVKGAARLALCPRCRYYTCTNCEVDCGNAAGPKSHACNEVAEVDPLENLVKGQDYQQCPGCEEITCRGDGCNHIICRPHCATHFCFVCGKQVPAHLSGHWQKGGCPRFGVAGSRRQIFDDADEHSDAGTDFADDDDDDVGDREGDVAEINRIMELFHNAAEAERLESNRMRITRGVVSQSGDFRIRLLGYVNTNLGIVLQLMQAPIIIANIPSLLVEFNQRHRRIREQYDFSRNNADAQVGTVTQLSDLSDEFDAYFAYALQNIADLQNMIAGGAGWTGLF
jgi:hypothetical protein